MIKSAAADVDEKILFYAHTVTVLTQAPSSQLVLEMQLLLEVLWQFNSHMGCYSAVKL